MFFIYRCKNYLFITGSDNNFAFFSHQTCKISKNVFMDWDGFTGKSGEFKKLHHRTQIY